MKHRGSDDGSRPHSNCLTQVTTVPSWRAPHSRMKASQLAAAGDLGPRVPLWPASTNCPCLCSRNSDLGLVCMYYGEPMLILWPAGLMAVAVTQGLVDDWKSEARSLTIRVRCLEVHRPAVCSVHPRQARGKLQSTTGSPSAVHPSVNNRNTATACTHPSNMRDRHPRAAEHVVDQEDCRIP